MTRLDDLYQATILEHDRHPRNERALPDATHAATIDNPLCGDVVTVRARLAGDQVAEVAFEAHGCALSRAAASIMTTLVQHRTRQDAQQLAAEFERCVQSEPDAAISDELGDLRVFAGVRRFRSRRVCALLPFQALRRALGSDT